MNSPTALDSFLEKWRSRWPEWSLAERFVPEPQRPLALAWFSLLQEFEDIMNIAGDPLPADAKLAWWQQELRDWSAQRSRHPLGRLLEPVRAPWAALAEAVP
ncbi:phytoene/squalene synthase family protein, partial [Xanthomonas sp. Kuri4-1]